MPKPRPDRRVHRTRRRLKEAIMELIARRDYEGISIHEITRVADVGRSTFYSHFNSKEELLFSGFDEWLLSLAEDRHGGSGASGPGFRFSLPFLQHIRTQKRFAQATLGRGSNARIRQKTMALLAKVVSREMERMSQGKGGTDSRLSREAHGHGVVGAFLGLVSWWLTRGDRMSPEAVDEVFQRLVAPGSAT